MARYTGPKHKLARREGVNILGKASASLERRLNVLPGSLNRRGRRVRVSEYGMQLREKQKLKRIYGLLEKQFRKNVMEAQRRSENTEEVLIQLLESRLDNVVFRLGFANSRPQARQMVSHGHILVDGKKLDIPSYRVKVGEKITISDKYIANEMNKKLIEDIQIELLPSLKKDKMVGEFVRMPKTDEIANPVEYQLVIEFYSR